MNLLYVEPQYYTAKTQVYFPIGPAYIASVLIQDNHNVDIVNANNIDGTFDDIFSVVQTKLEQGEFDAFAMGGLCTTFAFQEKLFNRIRSCNKEIILIGGGNLVSSEPEFCVQKFGLDYGIIGEGEIPIVQLCNAIENNLDKKTIPGLIYKKDNQFIRNKSTFVKNLDDIPMPAWDLFASKEQILERGNMPVFTSRSCPFHCTFCFHPDGSHYRRRSVANVIKEFNCLYENYGIKNFGICDELFGVDKQWTIDFCNEIKKSGMDISWECQMHVSNADQEMFEHMKSAGCTKLSMGFESGSDSILKSMKKKICISDSKRAISKVRNAGLPVTGGIIIGDFEESEKTISETQAFIKETFIVPVSDVGMIVPYPGSQIYERCLDEKLITSKENFLYSLGSFDKLRINMTGMSDEKLLRQQEKLSRETYSFFLEKKEGFITESKLLNDNESLVSFTCPTCGGCGQLLVSGVPSEIQRYCSDCCLPIYFNPLKVPHIRNKTDIFQKRMALLKEQSAYSIMVTPVGYDFMRLSAVLDLPMDNIIGFLDKSVQRLKHQFMNYNVYQRSEETVKKHSPSYIIVCSPRYQDEIISEMNNWDLKNTEIIPLIN